MIRIGVEYAVVPGFRPLLLDVHGAGVGSDPRPVVLFVHGGGWREGGRAEFCPAWPGRQAFDWLVADGFVVVSPDYRLTGEACFPAQLDDVLAALRWLVAHAGELGADPERIVLWGQSAGAHLAALAGLDATAPGVRGVVDWYGPADLPAMARQRPDVGLAGSCESDLIGAALSESPHLGRAASPIARVHAAAPPFHIAHGTADQAVPLAQSRAFAAALRRVGAEVEFLEVPDAGHVWDGAADPDAVYAAARDFARRVTATPER